MSICPFSRVLLAFSIPLEHAPLLLVTPSYFILASQGGEQQFWQTLPHDSMSVIYAGN